MSKSGWEVASGAKESGVSALFKGASLISRNGETVSALTGLQDKTALFYFASKRVESCRRFNELLSRFYEAVRQTDDSIVVIFVSNDESKEDQVEFFKGSGMHAEWLMVEWTYDLEDIAENFKVEKIPCLLVVSREGRAVVSDALDQVWDLVQKEGAEASRLRAAVDAKWAEWRRLAGDWRASAGQTLGGSAASSSSAAAAGGGGSGRGAPQATTAGEARNDREALRAARLAALEKRMGGGGAAASAGGPSPLGVGSGSASSSSAAPAALAAAPSAAAAAASPVTAAIGSSGPRIATLGGSSSASAAAAVGSGTFAAGADAGGFGNVGYTLAGGRVELPPPAPARPGSRGQHDDEVFSDMASDGAGSGADPEDLPDAPSEDQMVAQIAAMGFPDDAARRALQASNGDIDSAVALLLGE